MLDTCVSIILSFRFNKQNKNTPPLKKIKQPRNRKENIIKKIMLDISFLFSSAKHLCISENFIPQCLSYFMP